jgi:hypothetical protein
MAAKRNGKQQGPGGLTKWDAVRQALEAMGGDAKPLAIQAYLKDHLGMEVKTNLISVYKKDLAKKAGKKPAAQAAAARKGKAKEGAGDNKALGQPEPPAAAGGKEAGIPLDDILYVKGLVGRFGPEQLHTLIDAFAL